MLLLWLLCCAFPPIYTQSGQSINNALGVVSVRQADIYFAEHVWVHTFVKQLPCIDQHLSSSVPTMLSSMQTNGQAVLDDIVHKVSNVKNGAPDVYRNSHHVIKTSLQSLSQLSESVATGYNDLVTNYYHLHGYLANSPCKTRRAEQMIAHALKFVFEPAGPKDEVESLDRVEYPAKSSALSESMENFLDDTPQLSTPPEWNYHGPIHKRTKRSPSTNSIHILNSTNHITMGSSPTVNRYLDRRPSSHDTDDYLTISSRRGHETRRHFSTYPDDTTSTTPFPTTTVSILDAINFDATGDKLTLLKGPEPVENRTRTLYRTAEHRRLADCYAACVQVFEQESHVSSILKEGSRTRRGFGDWVGSGLKSAFGLAIEEDVSKAQALALTTASMANLTRNEVIRLSGVQGSMLKTMNVQLKQQAEQMYNQSQLLDKSFSQWRTNFRAAWGRISATEKLTLYTRTLSDVNTMLNHQTTCLVTLLELIRRMKEEYQVIANTFRDRKLYPGFVHAADVGSFVPLANANLTNGFSIVPMEYAADAVLKSPVSLGYAEGMVSVSLVVPVIRTTRVGELWMHRPVGMRLGTDWAMTKVSHYATLILRQESMWQHLQAADLHLCIADNFRVCPFSPMWRSGPLQTCDEALLLDPVKAGSICSMARDPALQSEQIFIAPITPGRWLISAVDIARKATKRCIHPQTGEESTGVQILPGYGEIEVPPACTLSTDVFEVPSAPLRLSNKNTTYWVSNDGQTLSYDAINVVDLKADSTSQYNISWVTTDFVKELGNTTFSDGLVSLQTLWRQHTSKSRVYKDTSDLLAKRVSDVIKASKITITQEQEPGLWNTIKSWMPWNMFDISIFAMTLHGITFVILFALWVKTMGPVGGAGVIAMRTMPGSLAAILSTTSPSVNGGNQVKALLSTTLPPATNTSRTASWLGTAAGHLSDPEFIVEALCVVIVAVIMHYLICRTLSRRIRIAVTRLGYIMKNRAGEHHAGEVALVASLVLKFQRTYQPTVTYQEVVVQLCTLPGSGNSWFAEQTDGSGIVPTKTTISRWSKFYRFSFGWGDIKLKSQDYPNLDAANSLPKVIKIRSEEVLAQIHGALPVCWSSVALEAMSSLRIQGPGYSYEIYHYSQMPEDVHTYAPA